VSGVKRGWDEGWMRKEGGMMAGDSALLYGYAE